MKQKLNGTEVVGEIMVLFKITLSSVTLKHHRTPHYMDHFLSYPNMEVCFSLKKIKPSPSTCMCFTFAASFPFLYKPMNFVRLVPCQKFDVGI